MHPIFKTLIFLLALISALSGGEIKYKVWYKTDGNPKMANDAIQQKVIDALDIENIKEPFSKVDINVYCKKNSVVDYFVVYMARADIYLVYCYRLQVENSNVVDVIENYIEEEDDTDKCYACPDPDMEALFTTTITEVPDAKEAIEYGAGITEKVGLKTKILLFEEQTATNVKNYLSCPKLKIWGFVGHGNTGLIQVYGGTSITSTYFSGLGPDGLKDMTIVLNSCEVHNPPMETAIFQGGAYFYGGGDENIVSFFSESVMKAFIRKAVEEKMEMNQAFEEAETEVDYFLYGWSGDGSGPPYHFKGNVLSYLNIKAPREGAKWGQGTFNDAIWESNVGGNVKIDLVKGSSVVETLKSSTENDGTEKVEIKNNIETGDNYQIHITCLEEDTVIGKSDNFSITEGDIISTFPHEITFEEQLALPDGWVQNEGDDIDWILISGPTPSREGQTGEEADKTGPTGDHTTGDEYYLYVEASGENNPGKEASIATTKFDLNELPDPMLSFWAHLYSKKDEMGHLYVDVNVDGDWEEDVVHIKGDQGDNWFEVKYSLGDFSEEIVRLRIRAVTGKSWCSDIAIDDFKISEDATSISVHQKAIVSYNLQYFNSRIMYQLPENIKKDFSINLYTTQGKLVRTLVNGQKEAGHYSIPLHNGNNKLAAGIYLCHLKTKEFSKTINILIQK